MLLGSGGHLPEKLFDSNPYLGSALDWRIPVPLGLSSPDHRLCDQNGKTVLLSLLPRSRSWFSSGAGFRCCIPGFFVATIKDLDNSSWLLCPGGGKTPLGPVDGWTPISGQMRPVGTQGNRGHSAAHAWRAEVCAVAGVKPVLAVLLCPGLARPSLQEKGGILLPWGSGNLEWVRLFRAVAAPSLLMQC